MYMIVFCILRYFCIYIIYHFYCISMYMIVDVYNTQAVPQVQDGKKKTQNKSLLRQNVLKYPIIYLYRYISINRII